jgi:hypothetical protein
MPIQVIDSFGVSADPAMPTLSLALDPVVVKKEFKRGLPMLAGPNGFIQVKFIRVVRYRPGRRCLIEYDVRSEQPGKKRQKNILLGKVRAGRFGTSDFRLVRRMWRAGFNDHSPDRIAVPKAIGLVPKLQMWLQLRVSGRPVTELVAAPCGEALARRVAEAAHKIHRSGVSTSKQHTMADELRILDQCLQKVAAIEPRWNRRLETLLLACHRLAIATPTPRPCSIHRDYYPDQVIAHKDTLYLLDFDLYCLGDPGLDVGNFLGHITEQSLREYSDPEALIDFESALEERFVELSGEAVRPAVHAYAALTLVRHIYLSTRFPERRPFTERLLSLCEERLGVASRSAVCGYFGGTS